MKPRIGRSGRLTGAVAAASLLLVPGAGAATSPGPAFVEELSSQLQPLHDDGQGDLGAARDSGLSIDRGKVLVDVYLSGDPQAAAEELRALGMDVAATATDPRPVVEGFLPLASLAEAARLDGSEAVISPMGGGTDVGSRTSEGVAAHNIPGAFAAGGVSGAGMDVGVISDSMNQVGGGVLTSQASGDLPSNVIVLKDDTSTGVIDEGRAMAEIIFDEAPGLSRILFASGTVAGPVDKADSIDRLVANGADVIADDIFRLDEPFFQDGVVAQAVDRAKAAGVPYFASAGNRRRQSYEGTFSPSGNLHDFDPGPGVNTRNCFSPLVPPNATFVVALGWDEPVAGVSTDLDLRLENEVGVPLDEEGGSDNSIVTGQPKEIAGFKNGAVPTTVCIRIERAAGSRAPFLKWIQVDDFSGSPIPQFDTQSDTINPDAASARGALAVAAVSANDAGSNTPESFSSRGPKTRFLDATGNRLATPLVLGKPELAAADNVSTTVPAFQPRFAGTSAAAPSAAGIATILRATNPRATVNEIYAQMTDPANAIPCASANPLQDCGAGFILADRAVVALDKTPIKPTPITVPQRANGKGGWFTRKKVKLSWDVTDPESPTEGTEGCEPTKIKNQGTIRIKCAATSGGGTGRSTARVKHDSRKPKRPKVKGIREGGTYKASRLPAAGRVRRCRSKDATSGLRSCRVRGFSTKPGRHELKATATDEAGLKAKRTVSYRVR